MRPPTHTNNLAYKPTPHGADNELNKHQNHSMNELLNRGACSSGSIDRHARKPCNDADAGGNERAHMSS